MNTIAASAAVPDEMEFEWNDERLFYREEYEPTSDIDTQQLVETTQGLMEKYVDNLSEEEGGDIDVDVSTEVDDGVAVIEIEVTPGKPESVPDLGLVAVAGEVMGSLSVTNPRMWDLVVGATGETAEEVMKEQAKLVRDS